MCGSRGARLTAKPSSAEAALSGTQALMNAKSMVPSEGMGWEIEPIETATVPLLTTWEAVEALDRAIAMTHAAWDSPWTGAPLAELRDALDAVKKSIISWAH
jgi:hypothetical protein